MIQKLKFMRKRIIQLNYSAGWQQWLLLTYINDAGIQTKLLDNCGALHARLCVQMDAKWAAEEAQLW